MVAVARSGCSACMAFLRSHVPTCAGVHGTKECPVLYCQTRPKMHPTDFVSTQLGSGASVLQLDTSGRNVLASRFRLRLLSRRALNCPAKAIRDPLVRPTVLVVPDGALD